MSPVSPSPWIRRYLDVFEVINGEVIIAIENVWKEVAHVIKPDNFRTLGFLSCARK